MEYKPLCDGLTLLLFHYGSRLYFCTCTLYWTTAILTDTQTRVCEGRAGCDLSASHRHKSYTELTLEYRYPECVYCKTLYFHCILILQFWNVEIQLHFNLAFSQCSTSIYQAFDGQTEFSQVFNFVILSHSQNSRKFDSHENV